MISSAPAIAGTQRGWTNDTASTRGTPVPDSRRTSSARSSQVGGSPIREMAEAARDLGHEYAVLTDHSPRLTVANGLSPERLEQQLDVVAELNVDLAPFRILTGIEVDILDDGSLDQTEEMLARLDVRVASVHSKLKMDRDAMTRRMVAAVVAAPGLEAVQCRSRDHRGRDGQCCVLEGGAAGQLARFGRGEEFVEPGQPGGRPYHRGVQRHGALKLRPR